MIAIVCGENAFCNVSGSPICSCLEGFEPRSPSNWNLQNWSDGCVRKTPLACGYRDGFLIH